MLCVTAARATKPRGLLWLPSSAQAEFICEGCGEEFAGRERSRFMRHIINCTDNERRAVEFAEDQAEPMFHPADVEKSDWVESLPHDTRKRW